MKRHENVQVLRARLARLVAAGKPRRARTREIRRLAERIATRTGEPLRRVADRAGRDAAALAIEEAFE
jgi:hypothetical protein